MLNDLRIKHVDVIITNHHVSPVMYQVSGWWWWVDPGTWYSGAGGPSQAPMLHDWCLHHTHSADFLVNNENWAQLQQGQAHLVPNNAACSKTSILKSDVSKIWKIKIKTVSSVCTLVVTERHYRQQLVTAAVVSCGKQLQLSATPPVSCHWLAGSYITSQLILSVKQSSWNSKKYAISYISSHELYILQKIPKHDPIIAFKYVDIKVWLVPLHNSTKPMNQIVYS